MTFSQVGDNADVCRALAGMVDSGRIPHAILFHEDDGGGAVPVALAFLQYLYCRSGVDGDSCDGCPACNKLSKLIHPDVHFIFPVTSPNTSLAFAKEWRELVLSNPRFTEAELGEALGIEGKSSLIAVAESKTLLDTLSLSALEGGYRAVVIYLPEKMNQEAANRLLKMIEEPPALTQFLLITHAPEKVLATISSRCQRIRVLPQGRTSRIGTAESAAVYSSLFEQLMDAILSGNLLEALEVGEALAALPSRESAAAFCKFAAGRMRGIFLVQQGLDALAGDCGKDSEWAAGCRKTFPRKAMEALDRARLQIVRNVNVRILFADLVDRLYMLK